MSKLEFLASYCERQEYKIDKNFWGQTLWDILKKFPKLLEMEEQLALKILWDVIYMRHMEQVSTNVSDILAAWGTIQKNGWWVIEGGKWKIALDIQ